jgi:hypothetical protein
MNALLALLEPFLENLLATQGPKAVKALIELLTKKGKTAEEWLALCDLAELPYEAYVKSKTPTPIVEATSVSIVPPVEAPTPGA